MRKRGRGEKTPAFRLVKSRGLGCCLNCGRSASAWPVKDQKDQKDQMDQMDQKDQMNQMMSLW